ncbi:MAG: hypothetical protein ABIA11_01720 [Patescibacteria group bacterium]
MQTNKFLIVAKNGYWSGKFSDKLTQKGYEVSLLIPDINIISNNNFEHNNDIRKTIVIIPVYRHEEAKFQLIKTIAKKGFKVIALSINEYPETSVKSYLHGAWKCIEKSSDISSLIKAVNYLEESS